MIEMFIYMVVLMIGCYALVAIFSIGFGILGGILELILSIPYGIVILIRWTIRKITGRDKHMAESFYMNPDGPSRSFRRSTTNIRRSTGKVRRSTGWVTVKSKRTSRGTHTIQVRQFILNWWKRFVDFFREDD